MGIDIIKKCLEEYGEICNIHYTQLNFFRDKEYQYVVKCDFRIKGDSIPIVIGIPYNWSRVLIDIYIEQHIDFPFLPHIDKKGKIVTNFCQKRLNYGEKKMVGFRLRKAKQGVPGMYASLAVD